MFLTPPRHRGTRSGAGGSSRARARLPSGSAGRRIATWTWGAGPRILLVHGWGGRGGQMGAFVEPLVAQGFSVAVVRSRAGARALRGAHGHDSRDGDGAHRRLPTRWARCEGIVAHSGGGAVSAWAIRRRSSMASSSCRGRSRSSRRPRTSAATSSASWTPCGLSTRAREPARAPAEARDRRPARVVRPSPGSPRSAARRARCPRPGRPRGALGGRRGDRGGLARCRARHDARARASPHPAGPGGRGAGDGLPRGRSSSPARRSRRPASRRSAEHVPGPASRGRRRVRPARPSSAGAPGRPPRRPRCPSRGLVGKRRWPASTRGARVTRSSCQATISGSNSMIRRFGTTAAKWALIMVAEMAVEVVRRHVDLVGVRHRRDLDGLPDPIPGDVDDRHVHRVALEERASSRGDRRGTRPEATRISLRLADVPEPAR